MPGVLGVAALRLERGAPGSIRPRRATSRAIVCRIAVDDDADRPVLFGGEHLHGPVTSAIARQRNAAANVNA